MDSDSQKFCTHCGCALAENARYCPECGTRIPGRNPEEVEAEKQVVRTAFGSQLKWAAALMLIYSIPFLIIGIYTAVSIDAMTDLVVNDPNFSYYVETYGLTYDEVHEYFQYAGFAYILSSVCGILSAVMCIKRIHYWPAMILCIVSIFTGAAGFFALFLGFFAFWMILSGKLGFKQYEQEMETELSKIV